MTAVVEKNQTIDKQMLKEALLELMLEDKAFFQQISQIVLEENKKAEILDIDVEDQEFDALTRRNFDRYEKTFKALA
jgi:hypothetical protein